MKRTVLLVICVCLLKVVKSEETCLTDEQCHEQCATQPLTLVPGSEKRLDESVCELRCLCTAARCKHDENTEGTCCLKNYIVGMEACYNRLTGSATSMTVNSMSRQFLKTCAKTFRETFDIHYDTNVQLQCTNPVNSTLVEVVEEAIEMTTDIPEFTTIHTEAEMEEAMAEAEFTTMEVKQAETESTTMEVKQAVTESTTVAGEQVEETKVDSPAEPVCIKAKECASFCNAEKLSYKPNSEDVMEKSVCQLKCLCMANQCHELNRDLDVCCLKNYMLDVQTCYIKKSEVATTKEVAAMNKHILSRCTESFISAYTVHYNEMKQLQCAEPGDISILEKLTGPTVERQTEVEQEVTTVQHIPGFRPPEITDPIPQTVVYEQTPSPPQDTTTGIAAETTCLSREECKSICSSQFTFYPVDEDELKQSVCELKCTCQNIACNNGASNFCCLKKYMLRIQCCYARGSQIETGVEIVESNKRLLRSCTESFMGRFNVGYNVQRELQCTEPTLTTTTGASINLEALNN